MTLEEAIRIILDTPRTLPSEEDLREAQEVIRVAAST